MQTEDRTAQTKVVVKASLPRVSEIHLLVQGTNGVKVPRSVLGDELENGVLTWEEMDNSVVQAC